ncbi:hypothetical protein ACTU3I_14570 [Microbacterium sp. RD1]|uniref:hypothetical protein n=1 Tax=Microbacterium sp. RD1 TaxID=3457313 RepID=UPI003FA53934
MLVSVALGAVAGWAITDARWSIAAALALTAATIGMSVGALWLRRPSWADKTWPPAGPELSDTVRVRRFLRVLGTIFLAPVPVLVALLVWVAADPEVPRGRVIFFGLAAVLYAAIGIVLLRRSFQSGSGVVAHLSHTQHPSTAADDREEEVGWRALGPRAGGFHLLLAGASSVFALVFVATLPMQILSRVDDAVMLFVWLGLFAAVAAVVIVVVVRRAAPRVLVNEKESRIRAGKREAAWSELTSAELVASAPLPGSERTIIVVLHGADGFRAPIMVRRREALTLTDAETALAARIVDASAVELPRAKEDPHGRFSRQLYPSHLTKQQARELIEDPPAAADPLPVQTART